RSGPAATAHAGLFRLRWSELLVDRLPAGSPAFLPEPRARGIGFYGPAVPEIEARIRIAREECIDARPQLGHDRLIGRVAREVAMLGRIGDQIVELVLEIVRAALEALHQQPPARADRAGFFLFH